jgi:hypothetical protein
VQIFATNRGQQITSALEGIFNSLGTIKSFDPLTCPDPMGKPQQLAGNLGSSIVVVASNNSGLVVYLLFESEEIKLKLTMKG